PAWAAPESVAWYPVLGADAHSSTDTVPHDPTRPPFCICFRRVSVRSNRTSGGMRMANRVGSGQHVGSDAAVCGREATRQAREALGGAAASFGFLFASPDLPLGDALRSARSAAGTQQVIGCTTAGEVTERGLTHGAVAVLLVVAPKSVSESATASGLKEDPKRAAAELCRNFRAAQGRAHSKGLAFSTTVVLSDGLSGVGEELVRQILAQTQALHQIVGGAAGDEGRCKATLVGDGERAATDVAAAAHLFGKAPWGVGIGHGLEATTDKMTGACLDAEM